jgi:hypothetical protein
MRNQVRRHERIDLGGYDDSSKATENRRWQILKCQVRNDF